MSRLYQISSAINQPPSEKETKHRKQYRKPQLQELGDLRTLTLGGSPGTTDSDGNGSAFPGKSLPQPGGFPPLPGGSTVLPDGRIIPPGQ